MPDNPRGNNYTSNLRRNFRDRPFLEVTGPVDIAVRPDFAARGRHHLENMPFQRPSDGTPSSYDGDSFHRTSAWPEIDRRRPATGVAAANDARRPVTPLALHPVVTNDVPNSVDYRDNCDAKEWEDNHSKADEKGNPYGWEPIDGSWRDFYHYKPIIKTGTDSFDPLGKRWPLIVHRHNGWEILRNGMWIDIKVDGDDDTLDPHGISFNRRRHLSDSIPNHENACTWSALVRGLHREDQSQVLREHRCFDSIYRRFGGQNR